MHNSHQQQAKNENKREIHQKKPEKQIEAEKKRKEEKRNAENVKEMRAGGNKCGISVGVVLN